MFNFIKNNKFKKYKTIATKINSYNLSEKSDDDLLNFLNSGVKTSDCETFAFVLEVVNRTYKINVYEEQIAASLALIDGYLIDMKTGEGKTIVAILTSIMLFYKGNKTTIFTANDYLVERDYLNALKVLNKLSITVGRVTESMSTSHRSENYKSDIIYTTVKVSSSDFMGDKVERLVEKRIFNNLDFAIIDEVDYILIDESTIPIAISKQASQLNTELQLISKNIKLFKEKIDFTINPQTKEVKVTDAGFSMLEDVFLKHKRDLNIGVIRSDLYSAENINYISGLYTAINANFILKKDVDYIVKDDSIIIIGKDSGRLMEGRRWSGGLHLAVEMKENVSTKKEALTIAESNIYYFLSKFNKISGMSGTTSSEKIEFNAIYGLDVIEIPTVKKQSRIDLPDIYSLTKKDSLEKILKYIKKSKFIENKKPILIGTVSVSDSELIYNYLKDNGLENLRIINAKNHKEEANIMSRAGEAGRITIATSMSGRGTDIILGSTDQDVDCIENSHDKINEIKDGFGGLQIIGFQRNRMRRLDNQLIGRSGRQGDNGSSIFFISGEDDLMSGFKDLYRKLFTLNKKLIAKQVVENQDEYANARLNSRKSLVRFANPLNKQNDIFYDARDKIIKSLDLSKLIKSSLYKIAEIDCENKEDGLLKNKDYIDKTCENLISEYKNKINGIDFIETERRVALLILDDMWIEHLQALENSRLNALNSTYKQADPVIVYEKEAIELINVFWSEFFKKFGDFLKNVTPNDFIDDYMETTEMVDIIEFKSVKLNYIVNKMPI